MAEYDRMISTAKRLITKKGAMITWRQVINVPNPSKPWETIQQTIDHTVPMVILPLDYQGREFLRTLNNDVPVGDDYGLIPAVEFDPAVSDTVIAHGKTYQVNTVNLIAPNGQKVLYTVTFKT